MISATKWVPRGAAAEVPRKADLDEAEMARIAELAKLELADAESDLSTARDSLADPPAAAPTAAAGAPAAIDDNDDDLKEYNMSDYDDEVNAENNATIAGVQGLAYYGPDEEDEFLTLPSAQEQQEEDDEMNITKTDNMLLAAKTEDDVSLIEVHVYDDSDANLYVHHDFMLPSFPLCLEWVPITPGTTSAGNFVAVGTFEPEIEVWDLDLVDGMFPTAILGNTDRPEAQRAGTGKKKRKVKKANDEYHVDAVLSLASNPNQANLLASASADQTIKLWDLSSDSTTTAAQSFAKYHTDKISSVAWNPVEPTVLLSGGYDGYARVGDARSASIAKDSRAYKLRGDVENVQWSQEGTYFYAGTDQGTITKFDARVADKPVWTLQAHDSEVTSFAVNSFIDNLMVSSSSDHQVKLWNIANDQPSMVLSRDFDVGKVFSVGFGPEKATKSLLSVAGSQGKLKVWDAFSNRAVRSAFARPGETKPQSELNEKLVAANDDDEESEDDE